MGRLILESIAKKLRTPVILLTLAMMSFSCGEFEASQLNGQNDSDSNDFSVNAQGKSLFFGYYTLDNYLSELQGHCNVVMGPWGDPFAYIREAKAKNMKVILWLSPSISLWTKSGGRTVLRPNYKQVWNSYAAAMKPYSDSIYGFYPIDEPYWQAGVTTADLNKLNSAIKASFPNKPIMVAFALPTIQKRDFAIPSTYDYVGYDHYGASFSTDMKHYNHLKSKLRGGQKIFLVGDGFSGSSNPSQSARNLKAAKIHDYYKLAMSPSEPIVGIFTFVWNSYNSLWPQPGGKMVTGVRDMPRVKDEFIKVGRKILGNSGAPLPTPPPPGSNPTPPPGSNPNPPGSNPPPSGLGSPRVIGINASGGQIAIQWGVVSGAEDYFVLWSKKGYDNPGFLVSGTSVSFGTDANTDYWVTIFACKKGGGACGEPTRLGPIRSGSGGSAPPPGGGGGGGGGQLGKIGSPSISVSSGNIGVRWGAVSGAEDYFVLWSYKGYDNPGFLVQAPTVTISTRPNTDYWVTVFACKRGGGPCGDPTHLGPIRSR